MATKHWVVRDDEDSVVHEDLIGAGGYGKVHRVRSMILIADADWIAQMRNTETEILFARKVSRPFAGIVTNVDLENEVRAIKTLCKTGHPNIVQVLEYGKLKKDGVFFYIDMDLCETSLEA
jgi:serine/threonine protein kinase